MKPEDVTKRHHRTKQEIQQEHGEWLKPIAQSLTEAFGGYYGLTIREDGEKVFSWEKKEPFKAPTNTILDRRGNYIREPVGTFWNEGLVKKRKK